MIARRVTAMAKSLALELNRQVQTEVELGDVLVAPEIGRLIGEVLVHAVRNAIDHGIEPSEEREAAGKPACGTIRIVALEDSDRVVVTISDDGRGIDAAKVKRAAIARGLLAQDATPTEAEVIELLFVPGLSTAKAVTAVSGRGVGMDVVKCLVVEHGGSVRLTSNFGEGTELVIELPTSLDQQRDEKFSGPAHTAPAPSSQVAAHFG